MGFRFWGLGLSFRVSGFPKILSPFLMFPPVTCCLYHVSFWLLYGGFPIYGNMATIIVVRLGKRGGGAQIFLDSCRIWGVGLGV